MTESSPPLTSLKRDALAIRKNFLKMHFEAQAGHIGTGLSCIEILTFIYRVWKRPQDRFILSKGHGASSLYATLHYTGLLSDKDLATYYQDGTSLPAHPAAGAFAEIPVATGSLGHGFSIACGISYSSRWLLKNDLQVAVLLSDGECNEGAVWEAALFASHHQLSNLVVLVDVNGLQGFGRTQDVMNLEPFKKKWEAFGFETHEVNGHDFSEISEAMRRSSTRPKCILAQTIKGKGVSFMEGQLEWHYLPLKEEQYRTAVMELEKSGES